MLFGVEEGFGETDPAVSNLFEEIWSVWEEGDSASSAGPVSHAIKKKVFYGNEEEEVDSRASKRAKIY